MQLQIVSFVQQHSIGNKYEICPSRLFDSLNDGYDIFAQEWLTTRDLHYWWIQESSQVSIISGFKLLLIFSYAAEVAVQAVAIARKRYFVRNY
ncbi:hypothetical protein ES703_42022 [subsurface metagenome]